MKKFIVLLVFMFAARALFSQSLGQDGQVVDPEDLLEAGEVAPTLRVYPYQWVDLTDLTKGAKSFVPEANDYFIANSTDEAVDTIEMGMSFEYFGEKYTSLNIVLNGFLALTGSGSVQQFGSLIGSNSYSPSGIPSPRLPNNIIAPLWIDIDFGGSKGYVFYRTFKPEVSNKSYDHLIVQWEDAGLFQDFSFGTSDSVRVTFEAVLFAGGGILFQYKTIDASAIKESIKNYPYIWNLPPDFDVETITDFDAVRKVSNLSIGYEDKTGLKGASWDFSVSSGTALGNELVPEWASGTGGDNFLDFIDGRDRRNNATTSSGGGGCFLSHKKASQDR